MSNNTASKMQEPPVTRRWVDRLSFQNLKASDLEIRSKELSLKCGISPFLAKLLIIRGHGNESDVHEFLNPNLASLPNPGLMKGLNKAAERIAVAVLAGELIENHSDMDVDGIESTSILMDFFRQIKAKASYFTPHRLHDGYGLSKRAITEASKRGVSLIISTDCGITNVEEAELCRELSIDLIISDHHQPQEVLPNAYVIVNPHQQGCEFPDKNLCGAGVAFYLTIAVRGILRQAGYFETIKEPSLMDLLDLVAIATVADLVPIGSFVNRTLVTAGLKQMTKNERVGLKILNDVANISKASVGTLGFQIGPRLNSSGRLDTATHGVELMLATDPNKACLIAQHLDKLNTTRKSFEEKTVELALELIANGYAGKKSIVLGHPNFHPGVVGIAASRIVEIYNKPTILIAIDEKKGIGKGSGRSIRNFALNEALTETTDYLLKHGGHKAAAGLTINSSTIYDFAKAFDTVADRRLSDEDLVPMLPYDFELPLNLVTRDLYDEIDLISPFGMGNPGPTFVAKNVPVHNVQVLKGKHLKFAARIEGRAAINCIGFNLGHLAENLEGSHCQMVYSISINEWRGIESLQCEVKDLLNFSPP